MNNSESTARSEKFGVIRKKVTEKDMEKWEVAQLKSDIAPFSRPSDLFEELEERRKVRHEEVLRQLTADLQAINLKMENNVKLSSEELKAHMKYFNDKLQGILQIIDVIEETSCDSSKFSNIQKKINKYQIQQQTMVDELYIDLIKFENQRTSENKNMLSSAFEKLTKIGYLLPYEIQGFLEQEVLVLNQLTLNNRRNYESLRLSLTLITEQTFKSFLDKIDCVKEKFIQRNLQKALLNNDEDSEYKAQSYRVSEGFSVIDLKSDELAAEITYDGNYYSRKAEDWLKKVEEMVVAIEFHGKELIEVHKKIVSGIYQNFDEKAQYIKKELSELEILNVEELNVQSVLFYPEGELEELEIYWNDNLTEIRMQLIHVNEFLKDVGKLWDRHAERMCESEKLILKALNKADENNHPILEDLEVKLNIALDSLRQEHTKQQLENCHEDVIAILNSIKSEYESMYLKDVSIIEDFYKMMNLEADVLSAEFKEFIYETQPLDPTRILHCCNELQRFTMQGKHITKAITGCAQRIRAVKQWQFGIWSAINALSDQTKETLQPRAEKWVQRKIEHLGDKKTIQLELLSKRFERIKTEIFEKRLREIETHEKVFDDHKKEIDSAIRHLKENLQNVVERESEKLRCIKEELEKFQEEVKEEDRPGIIYGKLKKAQRNKQDFEENFWTNFENYRANVNSRIFDMKQANIMLMESIKLFHEGGDYSSQESKIYASALEVIDKELDTELNNLLKESSRKETEIAQNIPQVFDAPIELLSSLYDETLFKLQIREKLQFFQKELLEFAKMLISDIELLNKQTFWLYNCINNQKIPLDETVCHFWNSVFDILYDNMSNLFYPMEFTDPTEESTKEEESMEGEFMLPGICCCSPRFTGKTVHFKKIIFRRGKKDSKFKCKDFKTELFESSTPPKNDGTFMGSIQYQLWTALDAFQKAACDFYKSEGRKVIRTDLIPLNYETFIKDILNRFKSYNSQCEQFWLYAVRAFLPILAHLKQIANNYLVRKLSEYDYALKRALKTFEDDFEFCLGHLRHQTLNELEALDEKLLTLYGYPQNQDLLSSLEEEVVQKTAALGITWESAIKKFKNSLKCFRIQHVIEKNDIRKLESHYLKFMNTLFVNDLGEGLLTAITRYCNAGGFCQDVLISTTKGKKKITPVENFSEASDLKLNQKFDLKTTEWSLKYLRNLVEEEYLVGTKATEYRPCPDGTEASCAPEGDFSPMHVSAMFILLELLDFNEYADEIRKSLSSSLERLKAMATLKEKVCEEDLFKWLSKWKFNVKKLQEVYTVKSNETPESEKNTSSSDMDKKSPFRNQKKKISKKRMADVENNKPQSEKTSASVTSTLPRLCPDTKLEIKNTTSNIPKLKSRLLGSRKLSNEKTKRPGLAKTLPINFYKSKLIETTNLDRVRHPKNSSLIFISRRDYHGQIPLLKRHSYSDLRMSPPVTRYSSPLKRNSPKEKQNKMKTISLDDDNKRRTKVTTSGYKKAKPRVPSPTLGNIKFSDKTIKRGDIPKIITSPRISSPVKKKSKVKVLTATNWDTVKDSVSKSAPTEDTNILILKQSSQPSLCKSERLIQPQEKISLDHLKKEVHTGDHRRLSFEKVHFCIEKKEVESLGLGERKRSYLLTYSSEDLQNDNEISLSFLKNLSKTSIKTFSKEESSDKLSEDGSKSIIRTVSGQELILTPSIKQHLDSEECDAVEISKLLNESEEQFEGQKDVHIPQDDASEYDSEVSTDGESIKDKSRQQSACRVGSYKDMQRKSTNSFWKSREAEIMNDVDYRQSVYHPTVSRRQTGDKELEYRPKSKSIENNYERKTVDTITRSRSQNLKNYMGDKMVTPSNGRVWVTPFGKTEGKGSYTTSLKNSPIYDVKRARTTKERFSGALLHFTLKIIRLLAIFNFWPGDNCYILTSQSLRFAR